MPALKGHILKLENYRQKRLAWPCAKMTCKFLKHSIFLSIGNWIKMRYTYTTEYYSDIKKNEILLLAAKWMALENTIFSEISQRQIYDITYMWKIKNNTNYRQNRNRLTDTKKKLAV